EVNYIIEERSGAWKESADGECTCEGPAGRAVEAECGRADLFAAASASPPRRPLAVRAVPHHSSLCGRIAQQVRRDRAGAARTHGWQMAAPLPEGSLRRAARRGSFLATENHPPRSSCWRALRPGAHHAD